MAVKKNRKKKTSSKSSWSRPLRIAGWTIAVCITASAIMLAWRLPALLPPDPAQVAVPAQPERSSSQSTAPTAPHTAVPAAVPSRAPGNASEQLETEPSVVYEERLEDFESKIRAVDGAILQAVTAQGGSAQTLRHRAIEERHFKGQEFYYQNLTIALPGEAFSFLAELQENLRSLPNTALQVLNANPRDVEISIQGQPTHHLFLPLPHEPAPVPKAVAKPKLVIIIDDLGENVAVARRLAALPFPVSFSVLPYTTKARDVARIARQHTRELLLHLPCEPEGYPKRANSGPGTLRTNMSPAVLEQTLVDNLARLPDVDGVNNHMGSRLTANPQAMRIVLAHLHGRGKFFVDSMTTPKSCVQSVSTALGMPYIRRHIFLDNTPKEADILLQLKKAQTLALKNGLAIAIGHPYPATLAALETWAKQRHADLTVCRIQDIR